MQVLHENAVAPVQRAQIPLRVCSTFRPELPGTLVQPHIDVQHAPSAVCFAGRRQLAMLRIVRPQAGDARAILSDVLAQRQLQLFSAQTACEETTLLLSMQAGSEQLHALREQLCRALRPQLCTLRENLSILSVLCRSTRVVPELLRAVEMSGAPVHDLMKSGPCVLMLVNDSQYESSLRAAYAVSRDRND